MEVEYGGRDSCASAEVGGVTWAFLRLGWQALLTRVGLTRGRSGFVVVERPRRSTDQDKALLKPLCGFDSRRGHHQDQMYRATRYAVRLRTKN